MATTVTVGQVSIGALQQQIGPSIGNPVIGWVKMIMDTSVKTAIFYVNNTVETTMVFPYAMRADFALAIPAVEAGAAVSLDGDAMTLNVMPTAFVTDDATHGHGSKITVTAPGEDGAELTAQTYWVAVFGAYAASSMVQETVPS